MMDGGGGNIGNYKAAGREDSHPPGCSEERHTETESQKGEVLCAFGLF